MPDGELLIRTLKEEVSTPDGWLAGDEIEHEYSYDTYPVEKPMTGTLTLMEWYHETREECITFGCAGPNTEHPFGVDIETASGMYHAHGAANFERGLEAVSVITYMMNHLASSREYSASEVKELQNRIEELEEASRSHKSRATTLENKNEMLRSQLNTLINTVSAGYDEGNWRGMVQQPQIWRPPTNEEIRTVTKFIDNNWYPKKEPDEGDLTYDAKEDISSSYLIVLDDFNAIRDHFKDKMLIYFSGVDGLFTTFFWDEHNRVHQINQDEQMRKVGENHSIFKDSN